MAYSIIAGKGRYLNKSSLSQEINMAPMKCFFFYTILVKLSVSNTLLWESFISKIIE